MSESPTEVSPAFSVADIYYVLFKHKWKIIGFTLAGLLAAAAVYRLWPHTVYRSDAKLFVRYIQESGTPLVVPDETQIKSTDQRGETIMSSELEILTSMDLAKQVAIAVGPERVLEAYGGGSDINAAAAVIRGGLTAGAPRGSRVIGVALAHPDRTVVQPVLSMLISEYLNKHLEIHMTSGLFDEILSKETLVLRDQLAKTEEELRQVQDQAGVVSLEETKRAYAEQMSKVRQQISDTEGEIAERRAILEDFEESRTPEQAVPAAKVQEYRVLLGLLETLSRRYQELLTTFTAESAAMTNLRQRMVETMALKEQLEAAFPPLLSISAPARSGDAAARGIDIPEEHMRLRTLAIRLKVLQEHMARLRKEASEVGALEMSITDLQRRKDLQESHYRYFSSSLEKTRINEALGSGRVSNISIIQSPTPPIRDVGKLDKYVLGLAVGGLAVGLALAFCLELFLDQTVRRAGEVESLLGLPLFFSIPNIRKRLIDAARPAAQLPAPLDGKERWPLQTDLAPYFDALRDRLIFYFEARGLTKKPKLVAVTSCGRKAGVSTVAAGLAAALSKSGEGNVLLVDMNVEQQAAFHFRNGSVRVGLDELLDGQHRDDAMVQDNLYVVPHATGSERLARILPKRFTSMLPRLRASDYDYIIFDMPAVSQVSVTPQLARFMDMVFLLAESEKTNRDALKRASGLLTQASCSLGVVVNRTRNYLPRALLQEV